MITRQVIETDPVQIQVWMNTSTNLTDQAIFLVRSGAGAPCFARVCTAADMQNYATSAPASGGWYRVTSLTAEESESERFAAWLAMLETNAGLLDSAAAAIEAATPASTVVTLRRSHTGTSFGTLTVSEASAEDCIKLTLTIAITDGALNTTIDDVCFVVTSATPYRLLRMATVDDISNGVGTGEQATAEITVYLNNEPNVKDDLIQSVCLAFEDTATFTEML